MDITKVTFLPTRLVGLHQGFVDVVVGGVGGPVGLLPLVQLLFNWSQGVVDSCRRGVRQLSRPFGVIDLLSHVCSPQRTTDNDVKKPKEESISKISKYGSLSPN